MPGNTKTRTPVQQAFAQLRYLRFRLRRFWRLSGEVKLFTPAFSGIFILTAACLGLMGASWSLMRLLPDMQLIQVLAGKLPGGVWELLKQLPALLEATLPSTAAVSGALVTQDAYVFIYAWGAASVFGLLLLAVAFIKRW